MLEYKVKRILLDNEYAQTRPLNMTQLAQAMDMSERHLRNLLKRGREDDIERIAKGLRIAVDQISP